MRNIKIWLDQDTTKHNFEDAVTTRDLFKGMFYEGLSTNAEIETYDNALGLNTSSWAKFILYGDISRLNTLDHTLIKVYLKKLLKHENFGTVLFLMQDKNVQLIPSTLDLTTCPVYYVLKDDENLEDAFANLTLSYDYNVIVDFTGKASFYFNNKTVVDVPNNLIQTPYTYRAKPLYNEYVKLDGYVSLEDIKAEQEMIDECTHDTDCHSDDAPEYDRYADAPLGEM